MVSAALPTLIAATAVLAKVSIANVRAVNTTRDWPLNANRALSVAAPAACLVINTPQGFVFQALGGPSGRQVQGLAPIQEIQIQISLDGRPLLPDGRPVLPDGRPVLHVPHNGPPC